MVLSAPITLFMLTRLFSAIFLHDWDGNVGDTNVPRNPTSDLMTAFSSQNCSC